jgi:hypothetical protein
VVSLLHAPPGGAARQCPVRPEKPLPLGPITKLFPVCIIT